MNFSLKCRQETNLRGQEADFNIPKVKSKEPYIVSGFSMGLLFFSQEIYLLGFLIDSVSHPLKKVNQAITLKKGINKSK